MTTDVQVVGQDAGPPPEEALPGPAGLAQRAWDNLRTGNLGVLPIVLGLALMGYPYFVSGMAALYGIGVVLTSALYLLRD